MCMISVLSNDTKTLSLEVLWLFPLVSMYIKQLPMGAKAVAPDWPVDQFVFVDSIKFEGLSSAFLLLQTIFQFCKRSLPLLGNINFVISIICVLLYI